MNKRHIATLLAVAAGTLFATPGFAAKDQNDTHATVKCYGANACKGQSECSTANNGCKGGNDCKSKGYIMTNTEKECKDKGEKVEK